MKKAMLVLAVLCFAAEGATINCVPGDDLQAKLAEARAAADGGDADVKMALAAGEYTIASELVLDRAVTVMAAEGAETKPVIRQTTAKWEQSSGYNLRIFKIANGGARVKGLELRMPQVDFKQNGFPVATGLAVVIESGAADALVEGCDIFGPGIENPVGTQNKFVVGAVRMYAGRVENCRIEGFAISCGGGVYMTGGTLAGCTVTKCRAGNLSNMYTGGVGGGVYMDGGVVTNCLVTECASTYFPGVGVFMRNGTLIDSTIAGNRMYDLPNTQQHCKDEQAENEGIGVWQIGGEIKGCVIAGNYSRAGRAQDWFGEGGTITGTQLGRYAPGEGNVGREPLFADPENGDWTVLESFSASAVDVLAGTEVAFAAEAGDAGWQWDFGDGETGSGREVAHMFAAPGAYTVKLTCTAGGESVERVREKFIRVYAGDAYVRADAEEGVFPYATPETATSNAWEAIEAVRMAARLGVEKPVAHIAAGDYLLWRQIDMDEDFRVEGAGPDTTKLWSGNTTVRALKITHAGAVASGVSLSANWAGGRADTYGWAIGGRDGIGVRMSAGTVTNCTVEKCTGGGQGWQSNGVGVYMTGGLLVDSAIRECHPSGGNGGNGNGLYASGGVADRCTITDNCGGGQHTANTGVGAYLTGTAVLRNSLVARNKSEYHSGAGIYMVNANALAENCTVVGNETRAGGAAGVGVYVANGTLRNSIVWGNKLGETADGVKKAGGTVEYVLTEASVAGTGNLTAPPKFADEAAGDYRLASGSPAIDAGLNTEAALAGLDLDRGERVANGTGAAEARVDMGCYEFRPAADALAAGFAIMGNGLGLNELEVEFTANVRRGTTVLTAEELAACEYEWDFGDGTVVRGTGVEYATVKHVFAAGPKRNVTLKVKLGEETLEPFTMEECVRVLADKVCVGHGGTATFPYATPETATANFAEACDAAYNASEAGAAEVRIEIGEGEFECNAAVEFGFKCRVEGAGPEKTHLKCRVIDDTFIRLTADGSTLGSVKISGARGGGSKGGAVKMTGDCTVTNCLFTDNLIGGHAMIGMGSAIYAEKGKIVDCTVAGNGSGDERYNTPIYLTGTVLMDRCIVTNNFGGGLWHCSGGAGVTYDGGNVTNRNCLIAGNVNYDKPGAGVYVVRGYPVFENCTITGNRSRGMESESGASRTLPGGVAVTDGMTRLVNCIVSDNRNMNASGEEVETNLQKTGDYMNARMDITYCAAPELDWGERNRAVSPVFKWKDQGDYHTAAMPGLRLDWMEGALDLAGEPRLRGGRVDMGCYAGIPRGTVVVVR